MIQRMSHVSVFVLDQDRAKAFYVDKLGFDVNTDATMGDFRWLTVSPKGQPDFEIALMPLEPTSMLDADQVAVLTELVKKGTFGAGVLETDDCKKTCDELKAKGVVFKTEPAERPWGIEALFSDDSGNWFSLSERPKKK